MTTDKIDFQSKCRGVLRDAQFGWNEYEGRKTEQLVCRFEILDGDDKGKSDTWFGSLSEDLTGKGKPFCDFTFSSLRACGWVGDDLTAIPALAAAGKLANEVGLVRDHKWKKDRDGNDVLRTSVKYVNRLGIDLKDKAMAASEVSSLAKRMKTRLGGLPDDRDVPPPADGDLPWER